MLFAASRATPRTAPIRLRIEKNLWNWRIWSEDPVGLCISTTDAEAAEWYANRSATDFMRSLTAVGLTSDLYLTKQLNWFDFVREHTATLYVGLRDIFTKAPAPVLRSLNEPEPTHRLISAWHVSITGPPKLLVYEPNVEDPWMDRHRSLPGLSPVLVNITAA